MHPRTVEILNRLEETTWFCRVGQKDNSGAAMVESWPEAIEYCTDPEWSDVRMEALNQFREFIADRSMERLRLWNDILDGVKKISEPLVVRKTSGVSIANNLPKAFPKVVRFDIAIFCMEVEYSDMCQPSLFTRMGYFYINGHFPCGWWGPFPDGKLIIY